MTVTTGKSDSTSLSRAVRRRCAHKLWNSWDGGEAGQDISPVSVYASMPAVQSRVSEQEQATNELGKPIEHLICSALIERNWLE